MYIDNLFNNLSKQFIKNKMKFLPGTKVILKSTGEVGIIIYGWEDDMFDEDYYVAFFEYKFPEEKLYILRYYGDSLELYNG